MGLDTRIHDRTARELISSFDGARVNQPNLTDDEATARLRARVRDQPRLASIMDQDRCVRRGYAILDQGNFHGTPRHEGAVTDQDHERRVLLRQDPAQPDPDKRARGIDGYNKGKHLCPTASTNITDPVAYLVALVRGVEHPDVRAALESTRPRRSGYVELPIADLLGPDGHEYCQGYRLVGDEPDVARDRRDAWLKARWKDEPRDDLDPPRAEPIPTFEGGIIQFRFGHRTGGNGYQLTSMFPMPPADRDRDHD